MESGRLELVVLVDGGDDVPGAAEPLGEDDEVAGAELHALRRPLDVRPHLALEQVARLPRVELHRELPRRATPLGPGPDAELEQAGLRRVALDGDGEAAGRVSVHAVRVGARGVGHGRARQRRGVEEIDGEWRLPPSGSRRWSSSYAEAVLVW